LVIIIPFNDQNLDGTFHNLLILILYAYDIDQKIKI